MARKHYWQFLQDDEGNPLTNAEVRIYLAGTLTEANIFNHPTLGSSTTSSVYDLRTNSQGFFEVWFGDIFEVNGYISTQKFKVIWTKGSVTDTIEELTVYDPFFPYQSGEDKDRNKTTSNNMGKNMQEHIALIVPSASPHNIHPYDITTAIYDDATATTYNRTVSNRLLYQMWTIALSAGLYGVNVSAARYHLENISSWTSSGSVVYADVTHNFKNEWPIVRLIKTTNYRYIKPKRLISLGSNSVRIVLDNTETINVVIIG